MKKSQAEKENKFKNIFEALCKGRKISGDSSIPVDEDTVIAQIDDLPDEAVGKRPVSIMVSNIKQSLPQGVRALRWWASRSAPAAETHSG